MYMHRYPSHSGCIPAPCLILFIYLFLRMECIIRWKLILKFQLIKTKWRARRHYHWWSQFVRNCKAYVTDVKREAFLCHILCCLHRKMCKWKGNKLFQYGKSVLLLLSENEWSWNNSLWGETRNYRCILSSCCELTYCRLVIRQCSSYHQE